MKRKLKDADLQSRRERKGSQEQGNRGHAQIKQQNGGLTGREEKREGKETSLVQAGGIYYHGESRCLSRRIRDSLGRNHRHWTWF
jgi:hypothetical protein